MTSQISHSHIKDRLGKEYESNDSSMTATYSGRHLRRPYFSCCSLVLIQGKWIEALGKEKNMTEANGLFLNISARGKGRKSVL